MPLSLLAFGVVEERPDRQRVDVVESDRVAASPTEEIDEEGQHIAVRCHGLLRASPLRGEVVDQERRRRSPSYSPPSPALPYRSGSRASAYIGWEGAGNTPPPPGSCAPGKRSAVRRRRTCRVSDGRADGAPVAPHLPEEAIHVAESVTRGLPERVAERALAGRELGDGTGEGAVRKEASRSGHRETAWGTSKASSCMCFASTERYIAVV